MNHSSQFLFGESSEWDPKEIRKRLIVSEDQMIKLNSIPGWTKVPDNRDTLLLDKDFSIGSSQFECSVYATQNKKTIDDNTKLFNEQIKNRKSILQTYKVYEKKLTRSLSLSTIDKSCENLNSNTLKRTLSLQSVCKSSDASDKESYKLLLDFNNKAVLQIESEYILHSQCKIPHPESWKNIEFSIRENSKTMATVPQMHLNIPTTTEKSIVKEENGMQPDETADQPIKQIIESEDIEIVDLSPEPAIDCNDDDDLHSENINQDNGVTHSNDVPDQLNLVAESLNAKSDSHSQTTKKNNDVLPAAHVIQCTNGVSNEPVNILNVDISVSSLKNIVKSCVSALNESHKTDVSSVKEISAFSVFSSEKAASSLNVQQEGSVSSLLSNAKETSPLIVKEKVSESRSTSVANTDVIQPNPLENSKPSAVIIDGSRLSPTKSKIELTKEVTVPEKEAGIEHIIGNCQAEMNVKDSGSDMNMESEEKDRKECDPAKYIKVKSAENESVKSSIDDEKSSAKKRKLESRNKRSKKHKSEEKQGTLKIRSIKKVGEVCYSVEEVKTMLDIMKQFS